MKPQWLLLLITFGYTLLGTCITIITSNINNLLSSPYVHFPSAGALMALLLWLIDEYWWNTPIIKHLYWTKDLSGRYEGEIEYEHPISQKRESKPCVVEIEQTGSKLTLNSYFKKSNGDEYTVSKSISTSLVIDGHKNLSITYNYRNNGNPTLKYSSYLGTNLLKVMENEKGLFLEGHYFTDREPQTKGTLKVYFKTKTLKKEF